MSFVYVVRKFFLVSMVLRFVVGGVVGNRDNEGRGCVSSVVVV